MIVVTHRNRLRQALLGSIIAPAASPVAPATGPVSVHREPPGPTIAGDDRSRALFPVSPLLTPPRQTTTGRR